MQQPLTTGMHSMKWNIRASSVSLWVPSISQYYVHTVLTMSLSLLSLTFPHNRSSPTATHTVPVKRPRTLGVRTDSIPTEWKCDYHRLWFQIDWKRRRQGGHTYSWTCSTETDSTVYTRAQHRHTTKYFWFLVKHKIRLLYGFPRPPSYSPRLFRADFQTHLS